MRTVILLAGPSGSGKSRLARSRALPNSGMHAVGVTDVPAVMAEGVFAPDLLVCCRREGVEVTPVWLDPSRHANFARRGPWRPASPRCPWTDAIALVHGLQRSTTAA